MTQTIINYAKALYNSDVSKEKINELERIVKSTPLLVEVFSNPVVSKTKKVECMKKIFDKSLWGFVYILVSNGDFGRIFDIMKCYKEVSTEEHNVLKAKVLCVTEPDEPRKKKIIEYLKKKYNKSSVKLKVIKDDSLLGGFIIQAEDFRIDMSLKSKLEKMSRDLQGM